MGSSIAEELRGALMAQIADLEKSIAGAKARTAAYEEEARVLEREAMINRVANKVGLPTDIVRPLNGDSEYELTWAASRVWSERADLIEALKSGRSHAWV